MVIGGLAGGWVVLDPRSTGGRGNIARQAKLEVCRRPGGTQRALQFCQRFHERRRDPQELRSTRSERGGIKNPTRGGLSRRARRPGLSEKVSGARPVRHPGGTTVEM